MVEVDRLRKAHDASYSGHDVLNVHQRRFACKAPKDTPPALAGPPGLLAIAPTVFLPLTRNDFSGLMNALQLAAASAYPKARTEKPR